MKRALEAAGNRVHQGRWRPREALGCYPDVIPSPRRPGGQTEEEVGRYQSVTDICYPIDA
jgi:hypothetical protein